MSKFKNKGARRNVYPVVCCDNSIPIATNTLSAVKMAMAYIQPLHGAASQDKIRGREYEQRAHAAKVKANRELVHQGVTLLSRQQIFGLLPERRVTIIRAKTNQFRGKDY